MGQLQKINSGYHPNAWISGVEFTLFLVHFLIRKYFPQIHWNREVTRIRNWSHQRASLVCPSLLICRLWWYASRPTWRVQPHDVNEAPTHFRLFRKRPLPHRTQPGELKLYIEDVSGVLCFESARAQGRGRGDNVRAKVYFESRNIRNRRQREWGNLPKRQENKILDFGTKRFRNAS